MSEDTWEGRVAPTLHLMLTNGWVVERIERSDNPSYVVVARRGRWVLEYLSAYGLADEGSLIVAETKDFVNVKDVRILARMDDDALARVWEAARSDGRIHYDKPTTVVADLAKKAAYGTSPVWLVLPGLKDTTLEALAVAGIVSMEQLGFRSDPQLLALRGFGTAELEDLTARLRGLVGEGQ
ncbi:hypothetical protein ACWDTT_15825 [Streptosporangium sandarakinum]